MSRCHFFIGIDISIAETFLVDHLAFYGIDDGQAYTVGRQHEVVPQSVVQVLVIGRLELRIFRSLYWIVEHGTITSLLWFVLIERPSQYSNIAVNSAL